MVDNIQPIKVVGGSTFGRYPKISGRRTYNMFASDGWLVDFSGWKKVLELVPGNAEGRGAFRSIRGNFAVAVINNEVWVVDQVVGATFVGRIKTITGGVFMDENLSAQICIVDGIFAYILHYSENSYTLTLQESGVQIPTELTPNYVQFHDTYFLIGNGDTTGNGSKWYAFSRDTDTTITETYELALQTKPDYAIAVVRLSEKGNNVLVFGTSVTEIQSNVGGLQGYQRISTINIDYGVLSVSTIASSDNMVVWLGINEKSPPVIMYFDGAQHHTISTDGINYVLGHIKNPEKSFGFFFKKDGHLFYVITFYGNDDNLTLCYDFNTQMFCNLSDYDLSYYPARQVIYLGNKSYFISIKNGDIYQIGTDFTTYDENIVKPSHEGYILDINRMIPRQVICETVRISNKPQAFSVVDFHILLEQGEEKDYSQAYFEQPNQNYMLTEKGGYMRTEDGYLMKLEKNSNSFVYQPRVDFSFSYDGCATFSNEVGRAMNFSGHRRNMMQWNNLGWMNEFTPKLKFWSYGRFVVGDGEVTLQN